MTIQIKATEQYFPVVLFIMLHNNLWIKSLSVIIQMKATKQHFPVVFIICMSWFKLLTLPDEILNRDH